MKFGKTLSDLIDKSNPEWGPFWMNYKGLKKLLKMQQASESQEQKSSLADPVEDGAQEKRKRSCSTSSEDPPNTVEENNESNDVVVEKDASAVDRNNNSSPADDDDDDQLVKMVECDGEIQFFTSLRNELKKLCVFYVSEERRYVFRYHQLKGALKELEKRDCVQRQRLIAACVHFYSECIQLEHFAIINYNGFSKILKKHDKCTGYDTRTKYMMNMVNQSPFAHYPQLIQILSNTEQMFSQLCNTSLASEVRLKRKVPETTAVVDTLKQENAQAQQQQPTSKKVKLNL